MKQTLCTIPRTRGKPGKERSGEWWFDGWTPFQVRPAKRQFVWWSSSEVRLRAVAMIVLAGILPSAFAQSSAQPAKRVVAQLLPPPGLFDAFSARLIGPHRGGRVTAVSGVAGRAGVFFFGATGGGVWKTEDYGAVWRNVSDGFFDSPSIGAIDVSANDPNVVFVGTGSACLRSNVIRGSGVYRSTDSGETWRFVGLSASGAIGDLVIDPRDADTVFVAAVGQPFQRNAERGVFRTRDGGRTWQQVLVVSDQVGAVDLAMDRSNPRRIFAAAWRAERKPWTIISGSEDSGLFFSADGGDHWERVTDGLPSGLVGKIAVEISPADPQRVWALVEAPGKERGLYRSDDGGKSFAFINGQVSLTYRPFYYIHLTADPLDPNTLYVNNETFWKSVNGGEDFSEIKTPHGDNHALWIHPDNSAVMVQGNDGGANVSQNAGRSWSPQWNQPTAEMYQVAVDHAFPYRVYGAQQDNTTISVPSNVTRRPLDPKQDWEELSGCETGPVVPHPTNPNLVLGGCKGRHSVYDRSTGQVREYWVYPHFNYGHDTRDMPFRFQRVAPMIVSSHDPNVIYHGSQFLHRSSDEGRNWQAISPDLTAFEDEAQGYSGGPITRDITGEEVASAIYAIAESPLNAAELWVGANDGPIHVTRDAGAHWAQLRSSLLPAGARVNSIDPSRHVAGRAWIAAYRYLLGDWRPYLFRVDAFGERVALLTDGSNGIGIDEPVRVVMEDPVRAGLLYVGTERGLYLSFDSGATFVSFRRGMPVVPITGIVLKDDDLVISTMGRSFWIIDDLSPLRQGFDGDGNEVVLYAPRPAVRARYVAELEDQFPGFAPEYLAMGASLYYFLPDDVDGDLSLEVLDSSGLVVRMLGSDEGVAKGRGLHRARWDQRWSGPTSPGGSDRPRRGPIAVPGGYRVRLTIGGARPTQKSPRAQAPPEATDQVLEQELVIQIDPRVAAAGITQEDLEAQLGLEQRIAQALRDLREAVNTGREIRRQLEGLAESENRKVTAELAESCRELAKWFNEIEDRLVAGPGKVGAEVEPRLEDQLTYLRSMVSAADQRPGADAFQRFDDVHEELEKERASLHELSEGRLAELEETLSAAGVLLIGTEGSLP